MFLIPISLASGTKNTCRLGCVRAGNSVSHGSHGMHVVSRRATAVTRRLGGVGPMSKDVKIIALLRDRHECFQSNHGSPKKDLES
jgi:hypothetical protein